MVNEVIVARDGAEALALIFPENGSQLPLPGLILLDLNLPKVSGLEVLSRTRADERTRLIPVVVLTSSRLEEDVPARYRGGASACVRKPVGFPEFAEAARALGMSWPLLNEPASGRGPAPE